MTFTRIVLLLFPLMIVPGALAQREYSESAITKLVLLGTGTPNPTPEQSVCALALVVHDVPYVIDFGPGLVVLYHILFWGSTEEELLDEISGLYDGKVIVGRDLDIF